MSLYEDVESLSGIGNKTKVILNSSSIYTIGDLVEAINDPEKLAILKSKKIRSFNSIVNSVKSLHTTNTTTTGKTHNNNNKDDGNANIIEKQFTYFIESHTWYEAEIQLPMYDKINNLRYFQTCFIFEFCIEPNDRLSFVCTWPESKENKEEEDEEENWKQMSYSPMYISHFNPHLPMLFVDIHENDWNEVLEKKQYVLQNTIEETNIILSTYANNN